MQQLEQTRRDSYLKGRGLSIKLGSNDSFGAPVFTRQGSNGFGAASLLMTDEDMLLDGADDDLAMLENFEKEHSSQLLDFDEEVKGDKT